MRMHTDNRHQCNFSFQIKFYLPSSRGDYQSFTTLCHPACSNSNTCDVHRNSTELSKYIWTLKDNNINFFISWRILSSSLPYKSSNKRCNLCLKEKFLIICRPELSSLNKRNELVSSCRHRNKALLRYS